jgi:hypothetical protein
VRRAPAFAVLALAALAGGAIGAHADDAVACPAGTTPKRLTTAIGLERWCERPGPPVARHGPYVVMHANGRPHLRGEYRDGVATGVWKTWYPGGAQSGEAEFRDGRTTGMLLGWHENGRGSFVCGFRDGVPITRMEIFDADGRMRQAFEYDARGAESAQHAWDAQGQAIDPKSPDAERAGKAALQTSVLIYYGLMASTVLEGRR